MINNSKTHPEACIVINNSKTHPEACIVINNRKTHPEACVMFSRETHPVAKLNHLDLFFTSNKNYDTPF